MEKLDLYKEIQTRTNGEIYIGIVGPVRTGKSTFIRKFMELEILPELMEDEKNRTRDALPASGSGNIVTTVEPKFIPRDAALLELEDSSTVKLRMIDCVGFVIEGAEGILEDSKERLVHTPWNNEAIPFSEAANIGTKKVIQEHSTVNVMITTDGSISSIPRANYLRAEKQTISLLEKSRKPYLIIINTSDVNGKAAYETQQYIWNTYGKKAFLVNCEKLTHSTTKEILQELLMEFPIHEVHFQIPRWIETLDNRHWLKQELFETIKSILQNKHNMRDFYHLEIRREEGHIAKVFVESTDLSTGKVEMKIEMPDTLYYTILSEMTGTEIKNEYQLISIVKEMTYLKKEYVAVEEAIQATKQTGYGIVFPDKTSIQMEEPIVFKQGNRFGVKIRANATAIHMIQTNIHTEISPIVGNEKQAEDLITYMKNQEDGKQGNTLIFGKTVEQMVEEGIHGKLTGVSETTKGKVQTSIQRIVNTDNHRFICIIV